MVRRRRSRQLLIATVLLAAAVVLLPPALYLVGLALAPPLPDPPAAAERLPPLVEAALWARFGGEGPVPREPASAARVLRFEWCMARAGLWGGDLEGCRSRDRGLVLTGFVAADHLGRAGAGDDADVDDLLAFLSTTAWIGRNWSVGDVVARHAASAPVAPGYPHVRRAAGELFGAGLDALTPDQAALLAALHHREDLDPRRDPAAARRARDRILERMAENGAIRREVLPRLRARPLGLGR